MSFEMDSDVSKLLTRVMSQVPVSTPRKDDQELEDVSLDDTSEFEKEQAWWLPGVCGQTRVTTNFGDVPAQLLRVGDHVRTRSGSYSAIRHIRETKLDAQFIEHRPDAKPVLIPQGSLNGRMPKQDVFLSPAQKVFLPLEGDKSTAVRAKNVSRGTQAVDKTLVVIAYYEILLEESDEILCEGMWVRASA